MAPLNPISYVSNQHTLVLYRSLLRSLLCPLTSLPSLPLLILKTILLCLQCVELWSNLADILPYHWYHNHAAVSLHFIVFCSTSMLIGVLDPCTSMVAAQDVESASSVLSGPKPLWESSTVRIFKAFHGFNLTLSRRVYQPILGSSVVNRRAP